MASASSSSLSLITPEGRASLPRFQYRGCDNSMIYRYVTTHMADWLVAHWTPRWMAPNLITFLGLLAQVLALAVAARATPDFGGAPPGGGAAAAAAAVLGAACLFFYSTMDNMDGKQARRTGSSSPLGLIFDHGCDAVNAALVGWPVVALVLCVGGPASWQVAALWAIPTAPFFLNTWEEFHVGALVLPFFNGPNEGLFVTTAALLATSRAAGDARALWHVPVAQLGPLWARGAPLARAAELLRPALAAAQAAFGDAAAAERTAREGPTPLDLLLSLSLVAAALTVALHTANVVRFELARVAALRPRRPAADAARAVAEAVQRQLPYWAILGSLAAWLRCAPCRAAAEQHWALFYAVPGCLFTDMATRVMVAHVCAQPLESLRVRAVVARTALFAAAPAAFAAQAAWPGALPLPAGAAAQLQLARAALLAALCCAALSLAVFVHQALRDIVEVLDIDVFSIERQVARGAAAKAAAAPLVVPAEAAPAPAGARKERRGSVARRR